MVAVEKSDVINSRFFPRLCSLSLIIFAIIMALEDYITAKSQGGGESKEQETIKGQTQQLVTIGILSLIYLLTFKPLGYIFSSILFVGLFLYFLGARKWFTLVTLSLLVPLMIFFVFKVFLDVPLPEGIFSF